MQIVKNRRKICKEKNTDNHKKDLKTGYLSSVKKHGKCIAEKDKNWKKNGRSG